MGGGRLARTTGWFSPISTEMHGRDMGDVASGAAVSNGLELRGVWVRVCLHVILKHDLP